jgi:hypothetical protein
MKLSFDFTFQPFLVLTKVGTASAMPDAFWPWWIVERVEEKRSVEVWQLCYSSGGSADGGINFEHRVC